MVPSAVMSGARPKKLEKGRCLGQKQAQLIKFTAGTSIQFYNKEKVGLSVLKMIFLFYNLPYDSIYLIFEKS